MGIKVPPRRYEKTTYLQKANARPPQHRKVMGLHRQQRATDLDCYELRTAKQANQRRGEGDRNSRNSRTRIPGTGPPASGGALAYALAYHKKQYGWLRQG